MPVLKLTSAAIIAAIILSSTGAFAQSQGARVVQPVAAPAYGYGQVYYSPFGPREFPWRHQNSVNEIENGTSWDQGSGPGGGDPNGN